MILSKLKKLANKFDRQGKYRSADMVDATMRKIAGGEDYDLSKLESDLYEEISDDGSLRSNEFELAKTLLTRLSDGDFESLDDAISASNDLLARLSEHREADNESLPHFVGEDSDDDDFYDDDDLDFGSPYDHKGSW